MFLKYFSTTERIETRFGNNTRIHQFLCIFQRDTTNVLGHFRQTAQLISQTQTFTRPRVMLMHATLRPTKQGKNNVEQIITLAIGFQSKIHTHSFP